jgi:hypothetical protein
MMKKEEEEKMSMNQPKLTPKKKRQLNGWALWSE